MKERRCLYDISRLLYNLALAHPAIQPFINENRSEIVIIRRESSFKERNTTIKVVRDDHAEYVLSNNTIDQLIDSLIEKYEIKLGYHTYDTRNKRRYSYYIFSEIHIVPGVFVIEAFASDKLNGTRDDSLNVKRIIEDISILAL